MYSRVLAKNVDSAGQSTRTTKNQVIISLTMRDWEVCEYGSFLPNVFPTACSPLTESQREVSYHQGLHPKKANLNPFKLSIWELPFFVCKRGTRMLLQFITLSPCCPFKNGSFLFGRELAVLIDHYNKSSVFKGTAHCL